MLPLISFESSISAIFKMYSVVVKPPGPGPIGQGGYILQQVATPRSFVLPHSSRLFMLTSTPAFLASVRVNC